MRLTSRSEYALLALLYLARDQSDAFIPVDTIAGAQGIPPKFLEQIMLALKRGRYLRSCKGKKGGYRLAKAPEKITLAEIIRFLDGALAPTESVSEHFYESTPIEREQKIVGVFRQIRDHISRTLESTTLADVC